MPSISVPYVVTAAPPSSVQVPYVVTAPPLASGQVSVAYNVTTPAVLAGLFRYIGGQVKRPRLSRYIGGQVVDLSDGGASATVKRLGYVGDSLTVQNTAGAVKTSLADLFPNSGTLDVNGLVGRAIVNGSPPYTPSSQDVINSWRSSGFHPNEWVIGLITNNFGQSLATLKAAVNTLLDLIVAEPVTKVLWVGPVLMPGSSLQPQLPTMYQALNEVAAARTDVTMVVLNMETAIHDGRDESGLWSGGDGRHMTTAGYDLRNQIIRARLVAEGMS